MNVPISIKEYLSELEKKIPELASSADLVKLGIFSSEAALCKARKSGETPAYIKFSRGRIRYPRVGVMEFLMKRINHGDHHDHKTGESNEQC